MASGRGRPPSARPGLLILKRPASSLGAPKVKMRLTSSSSALARSLPVVDDADDPLASDIIPLVSGDLFLAPVFAGSQYLGTGAFEASQVGIIDGTGYHIVAEAIGASSQQLFEESR